LLLYADTVNSGRSYRSRTPCRSQSHPSSQLRRAQRRRRSTLLRLAVHQRSHHPIRPIEIRRPSSFDSHSTLDYHPATHGAMDNMNEFCWCNGGGCPDCTPQRTSTSNVNFDTRGLLHSPAIDSSTWMSNANLMAGTPYSNLGHNRTYDQSPSHPQPPPRAFTYPPTGRPIEYHNSPNDEDFNTIYDVAQSQPYRRMSSDNVPMAQHPHMYSDPASQPGYYNPPMDRASYNVQPATQSQLAYRTPWNVAPMLQYPQAPIGCALLPDYNNLSDVGASNNVHPVPRSQPVPSTFSKLAPNFDRLPRGYDFNGQIDPTASSPPPNAALCCALCRKKYSNAGNLHRHNTRHCPLRPGKDTKPRCSECNKEFSRPDNVKKHAKQIHKGVTCEACGEKFKETTALSKHVCKATGISGDDSTGT
jgi:hypothetical protein